jgi:hypothetical protein
MSARCALFEPSFPPPPPGGGGIPSLGFESHRRRELHRTGRLVSNLCACWKNGIRDLLCGCQIRTGSPVFGCQAGVTVSHGFSLMAWWKIERHQQRNACVSSSVLHAKVPDTFEAALREADWDHDGAISLEDFEQLLKSGESERLEYFQSRLRS